MILAASADSQEHEVAEKIRSNEKKAQAHVTAEYLFYAFKIDYDPSLQYRIKKDPSAEPISISIHDQIDDLLKKWKFDIRKVQNADERALIQEVLKTLSDYTYYFSDVLLKPIDEARLIFKNSSEEEVDRLYNKLRPKSYELRCKMSELWSAPELDNTTTEDAVAGTEAQEAQNPKGSVVHQTVVNQYDDKSIHADHINNLNVKMDVFSNQGSAVTDENGVQFIPITPARYDSKTRTVFLGNETVTLLVELIPKNAFTPHELPYINALCEIYAEKISKVVTPDTVSTLSPSLRHNFAVQRKAYYSSESIQRSVRRSIR